jgi:adenosylcobyric acid synthase
MLGRLVRDPDHVESALPEVPGLGLVDQVTTLAPVKTTTRVQAVLQAPFPPAPVFGYELHMGRTESRASLAPLCRIDGRPDGVVAHGGRLLGTYIHGLLENRNFHDGWLGRVAAAAGRPWPALATVSASARRQAAYDRLADALRRHLDLSRLPTLLKTTPPSAESAPRS